MATSRIKAALLKPSKTKSTPSNHQKVVESYTIPKFKYDDLVPYIDQRMPEIAKDDKRLMLLLMELDKLMPGPNIEFSYKKVQKDKESFRSGLIQSLSQWELCEGLSADDREDYYSFVAATLIEWLDARVPASTPYAIAGGPGNAVFISPPAPVPVPQRKDEELIRAFVHEARDEEIVAELEKRSKGLPFLVYESMAARECDIQLSLEMLRYARKGEHVPIAAWGKRVFTVEQLDLKNRVRHECPICPGTALIRGACPKCEHDFSGMSMASRVRLRVGYMAICEPRPGQPPSSLVATVEALRSIRAIDDLYREAYTNNARAALMEQRLNTTGSLPTLLLVDDPVVIDDDMVLQRVDAFHRSSTNGRA